MNKGLKVPFRQVYAHSRRDWLRQTLWCHVVIRAFPFAVDLGSDALLSQYLKKPVTFYQQYRRTLQEAYDARMGEFQKPLGNGQKSRSFPSGVLG